MDCSLSWNYNFGIYKGLDNRLGITANVLGEELFNFTKTYHVNEDTLYHEPAKLAIVSGDKQEGSPGKILEQPIIIKVLNSKDNPVANVPVHFDPSSGNIDE